MQILSQGQKVNLPFVFFLIFVLMHSACAETLAVGDFVFRAGTGRESALIRHASGSNWSHMGVVVAVIPHTQIVHATTDDNPLYPNQVIISRYEEFADPRLAGRVAVARPAFLSTQARQTLADALLEQVGKPFVLTARDKSPRYCTTIIYDALQTLHPGLPLAWQRADWPLFAGDYLFPQAFAELPDLRWIALPSRP